jgi:hypothetical protein
MKRYALVLGFVLLGSCSGDSALQRVEDARLAIDRVGQELQRLREVLIAVCTSPPMLSQEQCDAAQASFNRLQQAYADAQAVLP